MRGRLITSVSVLVGLLLVLGCQSGGTATPTAPVIPVRTATIYPYSADNLNFLGLEEVWRRRLGETLKESGGVKGAWLMGDYVILETKNLKLYGFQRQTAQPTFLVPLTDPIDIGPSEDKDHVYVVSRNVLFAIDKRGFLDYRSMLKFAPSSRMVADDTNLYMGCFDGKVRAFYKASRYFTWNWTTNGVVMARPALGSKLLYAGSEDGYVYALSPEDGHDEWRFKTSGYIRGNIAYDKDSRTVFAASADGSLYALRDLKQGSREEQQAWPTPYASGAAILSSPRLAGGSVLFVNESKQCHSVNVANGKRQWMVPEISSILARGRLNTYCMRNDRYIVAIDNNSGEVHWLLDTVPLGAGLRFLVNPSDGMIYLMSNDGSTLAIVERGAPMTAPAVPAAPATPAAPARAPAQP